MIDSILDVNQLEYSRIELSESAFSPADCLNRADRNIAILAITANAFDEDRARCRSAGMNGFITKPFTMEDIHNALKEFCG